jgi:glycosyltransferase involved in cell wall biosynthesis
MKGRILCLAGWWPRGEDVAGIFIKEHVLAIQQEYSVVVIHMEVLKARWPVPRTDVSFSMEDGIPVYRITIKTPVRRSGIYERLARKAYRDLVARLHKEDPFTLAHIHVRTEATEQCVPVVKALGSKIVLTEHNSFYHLGIRTLPPLEEQARRRAISNWLADDAIAAVMPVSNDLANVLHAEYGVPLEKITVVPNVAAEVFKPMAKEGTPPFVIMLAAVWRPPKDHDVFIRALHLLPRDLLDNCRINWVGYGPAYASIQERCKLELHHVDIRFPGHMDRNMMAVAMREAHLFVLPTLADNLPCVVIESLCSGTPVVSMAVNGVPELVDDTNGILVPPSDPGALAGAIVQCIRGTRSFDTMAIAQAAHARFSRSAVALRIAAVYEKVLSGESA